MRPTIGAPAAPSTLTRSSPPTRSVRELLLRHGEVDVDRVGGLERDDRRAAGQVLPEVDLADPEHARERRADQLALDRGADLADARLGLLVLGAQPVELGLGDDALLDEAPRRGRG